MKKAILIITAIMAFGSADAQIVRSWNKKHINFSYIHTDFQQKELPFGDRTHINIDAVNDLTNQEFGHIKSNYGASFTSGRTFYLHPAIAGLVRFGIDVDWVDLSYTNYSFESTVLTSEYQIHEIEYALPLGLSLTFNPVSKLSIKGYGHFVPTLAGLYMPEESNILGSFDSKFQGNYAFLWTYGGCLSFGPVGVGIEKRFGDINYKDVKNYKDSEPWKAHIDGWRAYLSIQF